MCPTLSTTPVAETLERLHRAARGDWKHRIVVAPRWILSRLTGHDFMSKSHTALSRSYAAVTREQGQLLFVLARASKSQRIVEFGCSFGISTLYLAAAARDSGGSVLTTELDPRKAAGARANVKAAGLADVVTVLEGDALQTLRDVTGPIDLLFLDGMKHLYLPVLDLAAQALRPGSIVVADNVDMPSARPYIERVCASASGFASVRLFGGRMEVSYFAGP